MIDNQGTPQEIGTTINNQLTVNSFSQGIIQPYYDSGGTCSASAPRSGPANCYYFYDTSGALFCSDVTTSATDVGHVLTSGTNRWCTRVGYDAGTCAIYDSNGSLISPALSAGCTSQKNTTITGYYCRFYGPTSATPTNSAEVRGLPAEAFQTANVNTFCLTTGTVENKFSVALPPSRTISCVLDLGNLGADITSCYVCLCQIPVNTGGGSGASVNYNLYELNLGAPYPTSTNHQITTA
jgi:hypothetical protein